MAKVKKVGWKVVEVWQDVTGGTRLKEIGVFRSERYARQVCCDLAWDHLGDKDYLRADIVWQE